MRKILQAAMSVFTVFGLAGVPVAMGQTQPVVSIQPGAVVGWNTVVGRTYQLQATPGAGFPWSNLNSSAVGDGSAKSFFDPVPVGKRQYRIVEMVPATNAVASALVNGGFETGTGGVASNWNITTAAGGPVYAVRTNTNPNSGSYQFEVHLASTGGGPVVEFAQSGVPVTGGTAYPFTFRSSALTGSAGYNAQWRVLWNAGGDTGYQGFTPGNNTYGITSNRVTAPISATSATVYFHFAGAAITNQSATIDIDDAAFGTSGGTGGSPAQTNMLAASIQPVGKFSWLTVSGTTYQPETSTNLGVISWNTNYPAMLGDGTTNTLLVPLTNNPSFFRLMIPGSGLQPPTFLHTIASGFTNAIGLAWTASPTAGVLGYEVLYGPNSSALTNVLQVGNVTSAIVPNLTPGQTYVLAVIAQTSSSQSKTSDAIISAQPDTSVTIVPLFDASTPLQPPTTVLTTNALITYIADRARDRHAREGQFMLYDHYLSWYWEQRVARIQIIDTIPLGGTTITFNYTTLAQLNPAEFRTSFRGITTVAEYNNNQIATLVSTNASVYAGETDFNYSATLTAKVPENRPFQLGDRVEVEISQFLLSPRNGRNNYYGTVLLYVVGQGIVPWAEGQDMGFTGGIVGGVNQNLDSYPLPTNGWLGGQTTLPYQYSNEPTNHFKELAGNIAPTNGIPFMLGRRLHHTDFGDGTHSEPDNPVYTEQIGKLGPKFANRSCVACHVNNGRALPPAIGSPMLQSVVKVGSDASGTPHPTLGSVLQPQSTNGTPEGAVSISSYTTINGQYGDGTTYTLQKPNYTFTGVQPTFYSVRLAPQLVGLGLLEAVSESTIMALADPNDANQDGISGRIQTVVDPQTGQQRVGRLNYKAGKARVSHQVAGALNNDMGVTTSIFPILDGATNATGAPELSDSDLANLVTYVSVLGVSARRNLSDSQALLGEQLFATANCTKCHVTTLTTSPYHPMTELRNQTIHPYTDLLLHDMGTGLADNMGEGNASGAEWRTSPLWSIGLTAGLSGGEAYLHDGRARSLEEAILWHSGEGEASKEAFRTMSATNRAALVAFLKSL